MAVSRPKKLTRPGLLQATIAAMVGLLLVKSVILVEAAAEEAAPAAKAETAPPAAAAVAAATPPPLASPSSASPPPLSGAPAGVPPPSAAGADAQPLPAPKAPDALPVSEAERAVLLDLRKRREALEARAKELDRRESEVAGADRRLGERVQQLTALQSRLESLETARQQHKAENWAGLVKVYESMKPRDAAAIFDALDMQVLLQVLDRMQERKMAPVLAAMQPDRARLATQLLAEMRTRATTPPPPDPKG